MSATPEQIAAKLETAAEGRRYGETSDLHNEAASFIRAQAERVRVLERALKPFVEWHRIRETQGGVTGAPHHSDETPIFMAASTEGEQYITLGDLRRASRALRGAP